MVKESTVQKFLRSELSFYLTMALGVVSVMGFYYAQAGQISSLGARLDLLTQEVRYYSVANDSLVGRVSVLENRIVSAEKALIVLDQICNASKK